jgi:hypothetical protein
MTKDPIIAEIHAIRRQLWLESGGTPRQYSEYLQKQMEKRKTTSISLAEWKLRNASRPRPEQVP